MIGSRQYGVSSLVPSTSEDKESGFEKQQKAETAISPRYFDLGGEDLEKVPDVAEGGIPAVEQELWN